MERWIDVSPRELHATRKPHHRVIDVREAHELESELGHIEGIEHVPLGHLAQVARDWSRDDEIVVVCRSGGRSARAAELLHELGFRKVRNLTGGMLAWNDNRLPTRRRH